MNTGVFAAKYDNSGINILRCETAAVHIATSSKRKSASSRIFVQKEVLGFGGHVPRFDGRLFGPAGVLCKPGNPTAKVTEWGLNTLSRPSLA